MGLWDWVTEIVRLLVVAGVGIGSAQLTLAFERRRENRTAGADWELTPIPEQAFKRGKVRGWVIKNTGSREARDVELSIISGNIGRDPDASSTFKPGESEMIFVTPDGSEMSLRLRISWTSHRDEKEETSRLLEIAY